MQRENCIGRKRTVVEGRLVVFGGLRISLFSVYCMYSERNGYNSLIVQGLTEEGNIVPGLATKEALSICISSVEVRRCDVLGPEFLDSVSCR